MVIRKLKKEKRYRSTQCFFFTSKLQKQFLIGCFNHIVVTMVADKLERQLASSYYNHNKMQPLYG